jgi:hypothetical protein
VCNLGKGRKSSKSRGGGRIYLVTCSLVSRTGRRHTTVSTSPPDDSSGRARWMRLESLMFSTYDSIHPRLTESVVQENSRANNNPLERRWDTRMFSDIALCDHIGTNSRPTIVEQKNTYWQERTNITKRENIGPPPLCLLEVHHHTRRPLLQFDRTRTKSNHQHRQTRRGTMKVLRSILFY